MGDLTLFQRILPAGIVANPFLYNLTVLGLSLLVALVCLGILAMVAMLAAYRVSTKLKAEIAGMSIILLFMLAAAVLSLVVFIVLIATNVRFTH